MKHYSSPREKKVLILGLVALLSLPDAQLPPEVRAGMPQVTSAVLRLLLALKQQQDEHARRGGSDDESGNESGACAIQGRRGTMDGACRWRAVAAAAAQGRARLLGARLLVHCPAAHTLTARPLLSLSADLEDDSEGSQGLSDDEDEVDEAIQRCVGGQRAAADGQADAMLWRDGGEVGEALQPLRDLPDHAPRSPPRHTRLQAAAAPGSQAVGRC